jgi:hypothetical protein
MTAEMAREARGEPLRIHRTITSTIEHEMWVFEADYIYLDNGVVIGSQNARR